MKTIYLLILFVLLYRINYAQPDRQDTVDCALYGFVTVGEMIDAVASDVDVKWEYDSDRNEWIMRMNMHDKMTEGTIKIVILFAVDHRAGNSIKRYPPVYNKDTDSYDWHCDTTYYRTDWWKAKRILQDGKEFSSGEIDVFMMRTEKEIKKDH